MFNVKKLAFGAALLAASAVCFAAPKVEIVTSEGNIVVNLNEKAAPTTVANFVKYANEGFYNGTIFHRVINNFMIQGGGLTAICIRRARTLRSNSKTRTV